MLSGMYLNPNWALEHKLDFSQDSGWKKTGRFGKNLGLLLLGMMTSMAVHEFSHFVVAKSMGLSFKWPATGFDGPLLPLWKIDDKHATASQRAYVAMSGFIVHGVFTEAMLWIPQIRKDNLFVVGFMLTSILNNLIYPITDAIHQAARGRGYGDIRALRDGGANVAQVHVPLILHSLLSLARLLFLDKQFRGRFNPWATRKKLGADVVLLEW